MDLFLWHGNCVEIMSHGSFSLSVLSSLSICVFVCVCASSSMLWSWDRSLETHSLLLFFSLLWDMPLEIDKWKLSILLELFVVLLSSTCTPMIVTQSGSEACIWRNKILATTYFQEQTSLDRWGIEGSLFLNIPLPIFTKRWSFGSFDSKSQNVQTKD